MALSRLGGLVTPGGSWSPRDALAAKRLMHALDSWVACGNASSGKAETPCLIAAAPADAAEPRSHVRAPPPGAYPSAAVRPGASMRRAPVHRRTHGGR